MANDSGNVSLEYACVPTKKNCNLPKIKFTLK